jgi:hypothetical protein
VTAQQRAIDGYNQAWREPDQARRRQLLAEAWSDTASYLDPTLTASIVGIDALVDHIDGALAFFDAAEVHAVGPVVTLGSRSMFRWELRHDAEVLASGTDFVEHSTDGRITGLTNFFDPIAGNE